ncbi:MAG: hypothetical protein CL565_03290 [Alphaproteobacteria bacterium]|nr:hypothetical protein [Alphaproteobacteria bacterium]|tara:strand:- start:41 stop:571 length:531 start_codon:yes stop_codon:yes gene_type:complete
MNAKTPNILISYGLEGSQDFPELDKVIIQSALKTLTNAAARRNVNLLMRDHPGVTPMMEILTESFSDKFIVLEEGAPISSIINDFSPESAVFIGGADDVAHDHAILSQSESTVLLPLFGTGGAAEKLAGEDDGYKNCPEAVKLAAVEDIFGNKAIYELAKSLDSTSQVQPGGPAPI